MKTIRLHAKNSKGLVFVEIIIHFKYWFKKNMINIWVIFFYKLASNEELKCKYSCLKCLALH